ncbi:MAG: LAGLIDADG family homing endonuclease [bacterium]|nr:LAGLIDADG family homing endonuclease [bacterium]
MKNKGNTKYNVDERFFEDIDTAEKAYVLGFIWGDGHIENRTNNHQLNIEISSRDEDILVKMKDLMSSNHLIYRRERIRNGSRTYSSSLVIPRKKIVLDLIKLGMSHNKTWDLSYPIINDNLFPHFLRGLSDSDGCISIDKENRSCWSLISTMNISNSILENLSHYEIVARQKKIFYNKNPLAITIITDKHNIFKLRSLMYDGSLLYLNRKFETFMSVAFKPHNFSGKNNPFFGKGHSNETKQLLSAANRGENGASSKLTKADVIFIKANIGKIKTKKLADQFSVKPGAILAIKRGDTWSHIKGE